jgi:putative hydrolase of the HAD superfamily
VRRQRNKRRREITVFVDAVVFDFHQTLFRFEGDEPWLRSAAESCGQQITPEQTRVLAARVDDARRWPETLALGEGRDRSPAAHRKATVGWLRLAGLPEPLVQALYARLITPDCWFPYPDADLVLRSLAAEGVPVGVLSNTGWDLRETFERYGLRRHISAFALSCELGLEKPDPALFLTACMQLGATPGRTLMVGDNPRTDGGCVMAGLQAYLVPPEPSPAPRGLDAVLRIVGVSELPVQPKGETKPAR